MCVWIKLNNPKYIIYKIKGMQDRKNQPHINKPDIWDKFFSIKGKYSSQIWSIYYNKIEIIINLKFMRKNTKILNL